MKNIFFPALGLLMSMFVVACAPRSLNSGAENVHLYNYLAPKSCKFMGDIMNSSAHRDMSLTSSTSDLQKDDINFLKNEGAKLGANVVVLVSHASYETKLKGLGKNPTMITVNEHSVAAKAYHCSSGSQPKADKGSSTHLKINETPLI